MPTMRHRAASLQDAKDDPFSLELYEGLNAKRNRNRSDDYAGQGEIIDDLLLRF